MPRLKTAEQFAAVMDASKVRSASAAKGLRRVQRSAHFALHLAPLDLWPDRPAEQAVVGVICPKRWAKRAVTRNTIKRQVYAVSSDLKAFLPSGYYVVRLLAAFAPDQFKSATSPMLRQAIRAELMGLLNQVSTLKIV